MIVEQLDRMNSTLQDLSDFASPVPAKMEPMSVNSALESAIQLLHFDPRFRGIRLTADLRRDVPVVYGTASRLTQVAINILINAADAVDGEYGTIVVTSGPSRDGALITIEDNGHGMSKETCETALNPFVTTKPRGEGTGLGLAMCKAIIDEHRGTLAIDSEPGRGTRVQIHIPSIPEAGTR
jgi:signal transduction histidine kinase